MKSRLFKAFSRSNRFFDFFDADMGLEHRIGLPLNHILGAEGINEFEITQDQLLEGLCHKKGIVVGLDCILSQSVSNVAKQNENLVII